MGRPRKVGATKPGQLASGMMRYTFQAETKQILYMKQFCQLNDISVRDFMHKAIEDRINFMNLPFEEQIKRNIITLGELATRIPAFFTYPSINDL